MEECVGLRVVLRSLFLLGALGMVAAGVVVATVQAPDSSNTYATMYEGIGLIALGAVILSITVFFWAGSLPDGNKWTKNRASLSCELGVVVFAFFASLILPVYRGNTTEDKAIGIAIILLLAVVYVFHIVGNIWLEMKFTYTLITNIRSANGTVIDDSISDPIEIYMKKRQLGKSPAVKSKSDGLFK
jgi:hypothetical protein